VRFEAIGESKGRSRSLTENAKIAKNKIAVEWFREFFTMPKKETITPPSKQALRDASKELKKGHSSGGRTLADQSVAKREGAKRGGKRG
jgi:hypothetical protein